MMKSQNGNYIVATPKKGNVYAAKVVLNRRKDASFSGKSENTILIPNGQSCGTPSQSLPPDCLALLENRHNFEKSAVPERVMFFQNGKWNDFPAEGLEGFRQAFTDKKLCVLVETEGSRYLVDFLRMLQFDLETGFERSVAWIDVNGKCFFPKTFVGEGGNTAIDSAALKLEIEINIDKSEEAGPAEGDSEAHSKTRALEGGENGSQRHGVRLCGSAAAACKTDSDERPSEDRIGRGEDSCERVAYQVGSENGCNQKRDENVAHDADAGEGGCQKGNEMSTREVDMEEGSAEHKAENDSTKEVTGKVGYGPSFGEHNENFARIPDLNKREADLEDNEVVDNALRPGNIGQSLADNCNVTALKEFTSVKDNQTDCVNTSGAQNGPYDGITEKGASGASRKRAIDCIVGPAGRKDKDRILGLGKCASHYQFPEPVTLHGKPGFSSMGIVLAKLSESNNAYISVKNLFLRGMSKMDQNTKVKAVYWCSHASPMGSARLEAFQKTVRMTKATRGDANVRLAWYGSTPDIIESTVVHGFSKVGTWSGATPYGIGIYLTPEKHPYVSSEPDVDNEFHVVLCRVVMGNMEEVELGSRQFHPSKESFDNGVDNLKEPKWYIVWSTYMNTHVLPEYVVTFTVSQQLQEMWRKDLMRHFVAVPQHHMSPREIPSAILSSPASPVSGVWSPGCSLVNAQGRRRERAPFPGLPPNMSFPALFSAMRGHVPQHTMESLEKVYHDYKEGKFSTDTLAKTMISIAGNESLISALNRIHSQE
ncbi:probable inactive poly [ADP-ribose] polymerase SRO1 isoform X2 [Aristolochia californica]|uniref:probable inactive poly [ADP-ribose] polymerase SRO1 isoform X2 n=1 Tax=Aristolochia californica TaxID=171875 RepID=UPI0035E10717